MTEVRNQADHDAPLNFVVHAGTSIDRAAALMIEAANRSGVEQRADFNGHIIVARPGMFSDEITGAFWERNKQNAIRREEEKRERDRRAACYPILVEALKQIAACEVEYSEGHPAGFGSPILSAEQMAAAAQIALYKAEGK